MQVRVDAVVALRSFIDAFDTEGLQQVKPLIPQLLDVFFQLMQEVSCLIPQQLSMPEHTCIALRACGFTAAMLSCMHSVL